MPISAASSWITPVECFYVFNHSGLFEINSLNWVISIGGEVDKPQALTLRQLSQFAQVEVINTLECAGNGRAFFKPMVPGIQWERGAVGNATFRGPRLLDVLASARIRTTAKHAIFSGADAEQQPGASFVRSIPVEKALDPRTILATEMNGMPLAVAHGSPVRVIVPGWIGAASVKRVTSIRLSKSEAESADMQSSYRLPEPSISQAGSRAITTLRVKSIITHPTDGARLTGEPFIIRGIAWAGEAQVAKVEVSTDSGISWHIAHLQPSRAKYAWRLWEYRWIPTGQGKHEIAARATDTLGEVQLEAPQWNSRGYLWNGIDKTTVSI